MQKSKLNIYRGENGKYRAEYIKGSGVPFRHDFLLNNPLPTPGSPQEEEQLLNYLHSKNFPDLKGVFIISYAVDSEIIDDPSA